ncbi:CatB-related O-acetyltransferase [Sporosarcina sp. OR05]|uniref:CatB-related O-acetyltransferase n=1 Tax=Sporosarcina sp. OR05 TaxID=2969819 RepID=UPI00352B4AF8
MNISYLWAKIFKKARGRALINSYIHKSSKVESGSSVVNSSFGKHSFCGYDCQIINCSIGSYCSISNNVVIGGGMHPMNWVSMSPVFYKGKDSVKAKFSEHEREEIKTTTIGNDVWIGEGVLIKQGITIGDGAVIGMGSIVTKDVAPYTVVAGSPAKFIKKRFDDKIIEELLELKFWNIEEKRLKSLAKYITDPETFIEKVKK